MAVATLVVTCPCALSLATPVALTACVNALSRHTGTEDFVFKARKNLFETLTFVAQKPR